MIADCIERGVEVIRAAGLWDEAGYMTQSEYNELLSKVERGSREDVALSLWATAQSTRPFLRDAEAEVGRKGAVEVVACNFANMGMMRVMLASMEPAGVAEAAVRGEKVLASGPRSKEARALQAHEEVMGRYGGPLLAIAARLRNADSAITRAAIARYARNNWSAETGLRDALLPSTDRPLTDFLRRHGVE